MDISVFLAKVLGIYFLTVSIPLIFYYQYILVVLEDFDRNRSAYFIFTLIILICGILLISAHSIWVWNWRLVITLVGWTTFIKGLLRLYLPNRLQSFLQPYLKMNLFVVLGLVALVLGFILAYYGFIVGH